MTDARARAAEVANELAAEQGDDVLVLDWTRDAAKRCSREWVFNVMDGRHLILCSALTTTCDPADTKALLLQLRGQGVQPKVVYVDDECCGAWPKLMKELWPDAMVKLDAMHAIRRLTSTVVCTQHPWHGQFCRSLSNAIYTESDIATECLSAACGETGGPMRASSQGGRRSISNPTRIVASIEKVLREFSAAHKQAGPLLTDSTQAAWLRLKQHVAAGCLCDPPNLQTARGSSALEGFHTHQKDWLGSLAHHNPEAGAALLADGAVRWNRKIRSKLPHESKKPTVYAGGLLDSLAQARAGACDDGCVVVP